MSRRPYVREMPKTRWFLRQPRYVRYMAREVTCLFIGAYALLLLLALKRLSEGREAYESFLHALTGLPLTAFLVVTLVFALYHTITWFNVTPKALPIQLGETFLPGGVIIAAHYGGWLVVTVLVLILAGVT